MHYALNSRYSSRDVCAGCCGHLITCHTVLSWVNIVTCRIEARKKIPGHFPISPEACAQFFLANSSQYSDLPFLDILGVDNRCFIYYFFMKECTYAENQR